MNENLIRELENRAAAYLADQKANLAAGWYFQAQLSAEKAADVFANLARLKQLNAKSAAGEVA